MKGGKARNLLSFVLEVCLMLSACGNVLFDDERILNWIIQKTK